MGAVRYYILPIIKPLAAGIYKYYEEIKVFGYA